ncbi:hypothetical protein IQ61_04865 [Streptomyces scabiei]|nr:hypothetical protein IQ61_04865 [Streptomyces scabiei]
MQCTMPFRCVEAAQMSGRAFGVELFRPGAMAAWLVPHPASTRVASTPVAVRRLTRRLGVVVLVVFMAASVQGGA